MKVILTGGSGDLGQVLCTQLQATGHEPVVLDVRSPVDKAVKFVSGSVMDRLSLPAVVLGAGCIVHIAAWHGIHEFRKEKDAYDFFDLNVRGAFELFEAAKRSGVKNIVFISTTSVDDPDSFYGHSKLLAEQIAGFYHRHGMRIVTLRPRAFIPHWNRQVYKTYIEWANWFWGGAVHIDDVSQAVLKGIELVCDAGKELNEHLILPVDGAYEYTDEDLAGWDKDGPGSTFRRHYEKYFDLVKAHGLDPSRKPKKLDISQTQKWLGYQPRFSLATLLEELQQFASEGPPRPTKSA